MRTPRFDPRMRVPLAFVEDIHSESSSISGAERFSGRLAASGRAVNFALRAL
jgi:hypothetical protein